MATNNPVIPQIAQAFQNDPRTRLAQSMIQTGTSTAPVAQGGWGVTDGLARALQAVVGGYVQKQEQKKYKGEEAAYMSAVRDADKNAMAAALAGNPAAAAPAPGMAPPAGMTPPAAQPPALGAGMAPPAPAAAPAAPAAAMTPSAPPGAAPVPGGGGASNPSMDQWLAGLPGPQGGIVPQAAGRTVGAPRRFSSAELASAAREFIPGLNVTSGVRSARHNAAVGGVTNSQHVRGTAIDIVPPKGLSPAQVRAQYAKAGAQVDVIDEGDHYHIQGARNPQKVAQASTAAAPVAPTGDQQQQEAYTPPQSQTPLPALPGMPEAPADVAATQSRRLGIGRELLQSENPFAFMQGQDYIDRGLTEQNAADENAADRRYRSQEARYGAALNNYYGAQGEARQDAYATRRQDREFAFNDQQAEKAFGRQLTVQERGFAHDMQRAGYDRETSYGLAQLNNNAQLQQTMLQIASAERISGNKLDAATQKRTAFLSTPTGAKMWQAVGDRISQNEGVISDVQEFLRLNEKTSTGGAATSLPGGTWLASKFAGNSNLQQMEAITAKLAPMLRQAGSGAMSDKDLAGFRDSLPNITNTGRANSSTGTRIIRSMERVNDFERSRINAIANNTQNSFLNEWNLFKQAVPVASGKTFDDWRSSLRTVK